MESWLPQPSSVRGCSPKTAHTNNKRVPDPLTPFHSWRASGAYDELRQPGNVSEHAAQHVCFFMFVDRESVQALVRDQGKQMGGEGGEGGEGGWKVGLWRLVLVSNISYEDPRRTGKVKTIRTGCGRLVQCGITKNRKFFTHNTRHHMK